MPILVQEELVSKNVPNSTNSVQIEEPILIHDQNNFICDICQRRFRYHSHLISHKLMHTAASLKPFSCKFCVKAYNLKGSLEVHVLKKHKLQYEDNIQQTKNTIQHLKPYPCKYCYKAYDSKGTLKVHVLKKHKLQYEDYIVRTINTIKHLEVTLVDLRDKCAKFTQKCISSSIGRLDFNFSSSAQIREKIPSNEENLFGHQIVDDSVDGQSKQFRCSDCGKFFSLEANFKRHTSMKHKNKQIKKTMFTCEICSKQFGFRRNLSVHCLTHNSVKPYECKSCGQSSNYIASLRRHILLVHKKKCVDEVDIIVRNENQLGKTSSVVDSLKSFAVVDLTEKMKYQSKSHEEIERKEMKSEKCGRKSHICNICQKSFHNYSNLVLHQVLHSAVKPYFCKYCGCTSRWLNNLKQHILLVHKKKEVCDGDIFTQNDRNDCEVTFECEICREEFQSLLKLFEHRATHSSIARPYLCQHCNKTFCYMNNLKEHIIENHKNKKASEDGCIARNAKKSVQNSKTVDPQEANSTVVGKTSETEKIINELIQDKVNFQLDNLSSFRESLIFSRDQNIPEVKDTENARLLQITCNICLKVCENQEFLKAHCLEHHVDGFVAFYCSAVDCGIKDTNCRRIKEHCRLIHKNPKLMKCSLPTDEQKQKLIELKESLSQKDIIFDVSCYGIDV